MTEIDIERLRKAAMLAGPFFGHTDECLYAHMDCAVLALIERLEKVEAQRDRLATRLSRTVCYEHPVNAPDGISDLDPETAWAEGWNDCKNKIDGMREETDE